MKLNMCRNYVLIPFSSYVLADPNMEEEQLIAGSFTVICSEQGLYSYLKAGTY